MSMTNSHTEDRVRSSARRGLRSLSDHSSRFADDLRHLGHVAIESASDALDSLRSRSGEFYELATERGVDALEYGKERVERARVGLERYVSENPMKSLLIAAGIGAVIGYSVRAGRARRRAQVRRANDPYSSISKR
jgi:ElaB/YqjD/DUF883 family membrane-anchored ribosome-binding protein